MARGIFEGVSKQRVNRDTEGDAGAVLYRYQYAVNKHEKMKSKLTCVLLREAERYLLHQYGVDL